MFSHGCGRLSALSVLRNLPLVPALAALLALSLAASSCGGSDRAETTDDPGEVAFDLTPRNGNVVEGVRATLTYEDRDSTTITVDGLDEGQPAGGGPNPVWLRNGSCDGEGDVIETLEPLSGTTSTTTVNLGLTALLNGDYAVAVGLTKAQPEDVACGEVPDDVPESEGS